jgi:hypothetical protein
VGRFEAGCAGLRESLQPAFLVVFVQQRVVPEIGRRAKGARAALALCRPLGHHAASDLYGGYCFLNNTAIATQAILDGGAGRVAILDVNFHHGNGTRGRPGKRHVRTGVRRPFILVSGAAP